MPSNGRPLEEEEEFFHMFLKFDLRKCACINRPASEIDIHG
jgi:hypothetical protein